MAIEPESEPLSSAEKKELRGIAQRLKPHLHIGRQGLTDTVIGEIDTALTKNGLIKLRFDANREAIREQSSQICKDLACEKVGGVGKTVVLFRDMPDSEPVR